MNKIIKNVNTFNKLTSNPKSVKNTTSKLKELEEENLRIKVEITNYKKRLKKENEIYKKSILKSFILNLLPFLDNIDRALSSESGDLTVLKEGLNLALNSYLKSLENFGILPFNSIGKEFDPSFHDAINVKKYKNVKKNIAVEELLKGYSLNSKVIRPAVVIVSS